MWRHQARVSSTLQLLVTQSLWIWRKFWWKPVKKLRNCRVNYSTASSVLLIMSLRQLKPEFIGSRSPKTGKSILGTGGIITGIENVMSHQWQKLIVGSTLYLRVMDVMSATYNGEINIDVSRCGSHSCCDDQKHENLWSVNFCEFDDCNRRTS